MIFSILLLKGWSGDSNWWRHFWTAPQGYLLVLILKINSIGDWHFQLQHYVKVSAFVALFLYPTWLDIVVSKFAVESKKKFSLYHQNVLQKLLLRDNSWMDIWNIPPKRQNIWYILWLTITIAHFGTVHWLKYDMKLFLCPQQKYFLLQ